MPSLVHIFWQCGVDRGNLASVEIGEPKGGSKLIIPMFLRQSLFFLFCEPWDIRAVKRLPHVMYEEPVGTLTGPAGNQV